jgi:hypothetical protein
LGPLRSQGHRDRLARVVFDVSVTNVEVEQVDEESFEEAELREAFEERGFGFGRLVTAHVPDPRAVHPYGAA